MKRYATGILTFLLIVLVIGGTVWLSGSRPGAATPGPADVSALTAIETDRPKRVDLSMKVRWFGRAESKRTVRVMALAAGRIVSQDAEDEVAVQGDAPLFTLGGPSVEGRLETLRGRITWMEKREALAERSVQMKQDALAEKMVKRDELTTAEQALVQLQSELAAAGKELSVFQDALRVLSPGDGVFTNRRVSVGQDVEKGAHLVDIIAPGELRIVASLFPPEGVSLEGGTATIHTAGGDTISGTVEKVPAQRTAEGATILWLEGRDINERMRAGEMATGDIVLAVHKGTLVVPQDAVVRDEREQAFVFVKGPEGYRKQAIETGLISKEGVEVLSGVSEDDEVVVRGAYELFYEDFSRTFKVAD